MSPLLFAAIAAAAVTSAQAPVAAPATPVKNAGLVGGSGSPPTKQDAAGDPNEMVCKRIATTGTRFASKDCRTRAEWNQLASDSREATQQLTANQGGLNGK